MQLPLQPFPAILPLPLFKVIQEDQALLSLSAPSGPLSPSTFRVCRIADAF